ncbi:hypothetical protein PHLGIDRAFT_114777 [Phlebiopsis gigantea 11061_1 CR5-6]|uniref:RING-type domain-containing protein n=1 Tax=Phlebiopsis gigantea (strain 11061_1 CR5-6) TaxID=745531 RepID=A0A0C3SEX8_PHLG1|nr:hypothetical protein PHLGIDRAFT_114777 [Phlebiopsis gigantea 11061_1 CR5-6]
MSSREPLWYCHECHSEMRPLMVPDPHCASCNGTFVEKLENPADDPREFTHGVTDDDDPFGQDDFLFGLQNLLRVSERQTGSSRPQTLGGSPPLSGGGRSAFTFGPTSGRTVHINHSSAPGERVRTTVSVRSPQVNDIPSLSEFARQSGRPDRGDIDGPLMFQYMLAMLSQPGRRGPGPELFESMMGGGGGPEGGRMGDYVFNQEALDQIMTQLMESSSSHPVAAPTEVIEKLPREVLEEESPLLEKDCAVCKEQFQLGTEDPDEQIVVTLPCKHPFHEPCIMPWLKSSGTCPVCRYQLVPQPSHHAPGPGPPSGSSSGNPEGNGNGSARGNGANGGNGNFGQRSPGQQGFPPGGAGGIFGNLFSMFGNAIHAAASGANTTRDGDTHNDAGGNANSHGAQTSGSPRPSRSTSDPAARRRSGDQSSRRNEDDHEFPGGWDGVD